MTKEQKFYKTLQDVFIGAKIEGEGGFVILMRIKSNYYRKIEDILKKDIEEALKSYPNFKDELFDKLYSFFSRYFTESGSIYFNSTPFHNNIYEKVYTDEKDVILFWKTQMLYYVKTDRIFRSLPVEFDGFKFYFDASKIESKKANEKRSLIYELKEIREDNTIVFAVLYSEKGTKTKQDEILKAIKRKGIAITEDQLERAFRVFEKQSEVDFFINKNAKAFLQEQFKLWSYQYFWEGAKEWDADRVNELQILKDIAFKIIDFVSQFEDELVKIWNKPKFVKNSNYVITLDRIKDKTLVEKIKRHKNYKEQVEEWGELGIDKDNPKTPIDTRYFKDLELEILNQFEDLDKSLDGWLIKSENYQALNTILPKFKEKVQTIHIDPPYNTDTSGFLYANRFRHSSWLTMMENRLRLGIDFLQAKGAFLTHVDENEFERLKLFFDQIDIGDAGTIVWDKRNPMTAGAGVALQHEYVLWRTNFVIPISMRNGNARLILAKANEVIRKYNGTTTKAKKEYADWIRINPSLSGGEKAYRFIDEQGRVYRSVSLRAPEPRTDPKFFKPLIHPITGKPCPVPPNGFSRTPETLQEMISRGEIIFGSDETTQPNQKRFLTEESEMQLRSIIQDANKGKADLDNLGLNFPYCHPVSLYETLISAASLDTFDIIIDFFAGSGTTAHAVIKLNSKDNGNRKFILVEMDNYFESVIIPRIKKISYSLNWRNGKPQDIEGRGCFFKYYELEQYEETLANCKYEDGDLFNSPSKTPYQEYVFMKDEKMLKTLEIDYENNKVEVDLSQLYPNIDIAETLSNLTGKWIKKISDGEVEFEDGTKVNTKDLDYKLIKPLIWW